MMNLKKSEDAWKAYKNSPFYWRHGIPEDREHISFEIFLVGWTECQQEALKILTSSWTGLDMSINSCDSHYIEKVKEL